MAEAADAKEKAAKIATVNVASASLLRRLMLRVPEFKTTRTPLLNDCPIGILTRLYPIDKPLNRGASGETATP